MADVTRTFIALDVAPALEPRLRRLQQDLAPDIPGARWVDRAAFHITLIFLGDVPHSDLAGVCRAVGQAVEPFTPFELELKGVGVFPNPQRPRVIWAGVGGAGVDAIQEVQGAVAQAVSDLGYPPDPLPFHPHVTLARIEAPRRRGGRGRPHEGTSPGVVVTDLERTLNRRRNWSAGPFRVTEVIAYSSTLTREGPVYAPLSRAPLRARPASDRPARAPTPGS